MAPAPRWPRRLRLGAPAGLAALAGLHLAAAEWWLAASWPGATGLIREDLIAVATTGIAYAALALGSARWGLVRGRLWAMTLGFALLLPWSFFLYLAGLAAFFPDDEMEEQMGHPWLPLMVGTLGWALAILGAIGVAGDPTLPR